MRRPLYIAVGGLCLILAVIVAVELNLTVSDVAASPSSRLNEDATAGDDAAPDDPDAIVASILERPIFAPDRRGPPAPKGEDDQVATADKSAPEIRGRLAGVTIGPGDEREAVFAREGEKPLVVKEGDDVDGWTVSSIEAGKVLLTSTFGQRTVEPTFGTSGDAPPPRTKPAKEKDIAGAEPASNPGMPQPPFNRRPPPHLAGPPSPRANPMQHKPAPTPSSRRRDPS